MSRRVRRRAAEVAVALFFTFSGAALADTSEMFAAEEGGRPLQLEVSINGTSTNLIGSFHQLANGDLATTRSELTGLGLDVPGPSPDDIVVIDRLPGLQYMYDEATQKLALRVDDSLRVVRVYDARGASLDPIEPASDYGAVLNYDLFVHNVWEKSETRFGGANAALEGRFFGEFGLLNQSVALNLTTDKHFEAIRLDTTWSYADPDELVTYRAGDVITGGLRWTRPVRLGGVQVQRSFGLRPDLITFPLPSYTGSAAVPSTVDLYVNGLLTNSQNIPSGPYQFSNIPISPGYGDVTVIVEDSAGRRTETDLSFYGTLQLLREGLSSFSAELGFPRVFFGSDKSRYVGEAAASATFVHGVKDWLTIEAHAEVGHGLINGGLGTITRLGNYGVASVAASASRLDKETGFQTSLAYDLQLAELNIHAASLRTWEDYSDLGVATMKGPSFRQPKALDSISFGMPLASGDSQIGATFLHQEDGDGARRSSVSLSYRQPLFQGATLYLSAFGDVDGGDNYGAFAGVSMSIGSNDEDDDFTLSTGVEASRSGTTATLDASKATDATAGSFGWQMHLAEGNTTFRRAAANYRGELIDVGAAVQQSENDVDASLQAAGAIVMLGTDPFLSRRINDGFAVVDTGAPGVRVERENRPVGVSDSRGLLLVTDVQSYNRNKVSIDVRDLPLTATAGTREKVVAPKERSGVRVSFGVDVDANSALVILKDQRGQFIAPGTSGRVQETGERFVVGYDGQAFLHHLRSHNTVSVDTVIACQASFAYTPTKAQQVVIGPLTCE